MDKTGVKKTKNTKKVFKKPNTYVIIELEKESSKYEYL
jgi:hypothetical protein